jgi:DNA ligase (NAD+)
LAGTIVKRANLCNPALLSSLGIKIGSKVVMVKRGEIIPKIERVLETPADAIPISIPENCECCGSLLTVEPSAVYCPNPKCDLTLEHRILKWTETVGIKFLGSAIIHTLYSAGAVKSVWGLYLARQKTLAPLIGEKVADKIVLEVSKHHDVTLPQLFAGYDLDGIGESAITLIQRAGYVTLEQIQATTIAALSDIKGIGFITAKKIKDALELYGLDFKILTASGSGLINLVYPSGEKLPLSGISFCFTGELTSLKREEAERNVKNLGGDILGSVSKNLSYLVTNDPDSGSSKANKAKELGIPIIDEVAFITMIQNAK